MTIEVEGPDGAVIEFPDGTAPDLIKGVMAKQYARPSAAADVGEALIRGVNKGLVGAATLPYRAIDWLGEKVTGGDFLPNVEEMSLYKPFLQQPEPKTQAGRYAGATGEAIGGSAIPTGAVLGKAEKLAQLAPTNTIRAIGQQMGELAAKRPGLAVGADVVGSTGYGIGQKYAEEEGAGPIGQTVAGIAGAMTPVAGAQAVGRFARAIDPMISPTLARWRANLDASGVPQKLGTLAADESGNIPVAGAASPSTPSGPPPVSGAQAAAEQMLANSLIREGVKPGELPAMLEAIAYAGRMNSNSNAQNVTALFDLTPGLQRTLSALMRKSPELAKQAKEFITYRQTGQSPKGGELAEAGIPTRKPLSEPITAEESKDLYGTDFGAGSGNNVSMGQGERLGDLIKRSLLIKDSDWHGHGANARLTNDAILAKAESDANALYGKMRADSKGYDIRPHLKPVVDEIVARINSPETARAEAELLKKALYQFTTVQSKGREMVSSLDAFDSAKRTIDDWIEKAALDKQKNIARILRGTEENPGFLRKMLAAVDGIEEKGIGKTYQEARSKYSSAMEAIEEIQVGRNAWKDDAATGIEDFRKIKSEEGQKRARLGYLAEYEDQTANMKHGDDKTRLFDKPRVHQMLREMIPKSKDADAVFADRPERVGSYIANERRMIESRDEALGNSKTAQRQLDDAALDNSQTVAETMQRIKESATLTAVALRVAERAFQKLFGMRADTSRELSRMLFTAKPDQQAAILQRVEALIGRDKFAEFSALMQQVRTGAVPGVAAGGARINDQGLLESDIPNPFRRPQSK